jgi:hypothetical protein
MKWPSLILLSFLLFTACQDKAREAQREEGVEKLTPSLEAWIHNGFEFSWEKGQPMPDEVRQVWSQLGRGGAGYGFRTFQARGDTARSNTNQASQAILASMEHWRVTLDELHTSVIGEIGLAWGVYTEEFKVKDQPPETVRVRFTNTLRWNGQAWRKISSITVTPKRSRRMVGN